MLKKKINKYFLFVYSGIFYWSTSKDKFELTKETVTGHLSGFIGLFFILIISIISRLNLIKLEVHIKEYKFIILLIMGILAYFLIIKPINKYLITNISKNSIESKFKKNHTNKRNTIKNFLWNIFGFCFVLIALGTSIKGIIYPLIDLLK